jgi:tRNA 2-thiouridine synthesizing protein B
MLHTINKSPFEKNSLQSCLALARPGSAILLFEDGIYAALKGTRFEATVTQALQKHNIYVLAPDLEARGMAAERVIAGVRLTDYAGFVDLVTENNAVQAWL